MSKKAEQKFGEWLESKGVKDIEYAPDGLFEDWDIKTPTDTYEIKFDRWIGNTGNLCLETWSCVERSSMGWLFTSKANWLVVFYDENNFYGFEMAKLRELWMYKPGLFIRKEIKQTSWTTVCYLCHLSQIPFKSRGSVTQ